MKEEDLIKFVAIVEKVQTLKDGGLRLTLDLSEDSIEQAKALMDVKRLGYILECVFVAVKA
jgi:hypothetical protein